MFTVTCPAHGSTVLLSTRSIERLVNTDAGIEVHWRCHCGHRGTSLTGRGATIAPAPVEVPADLHGEDACEAGSAALPRGRARVVAG